MLHIDNLCKEIEDERKRLNAKIESDTEPYRKELNHNISSLKHDEHVNEQVNEQVNEPVEE